MNQPSVAIILVNWNGYKDTKECLESLTLMSYSNFQVFIVDNCSTDNSYEKLESLVKNNNYSYKINLLKTERNLGFAGGNNVAIKLVQSMGIKYIWLLNNDTIVENKALYALIDCMEKRKDVGIAGSKIYYYKNNIIWFAGGKFDIRTGKTAHIGYKKKDDGSYNTVKEVDYITGCSLIFRTDLINEIGYISEDYFLYYEETDFNIKAFQHGWKIIIVPESKIYHKVSMASGGEKNISPITEYYYTRNRYWVCKRNSSGIHYLAFLYMVYKSVKNIAKIIVKNQTNKSVRIKYILKGIRDALF
ncbi:glycosyltransferase family 2 protein [Sporolactobacillus laevolacticus]|uniref:glycosyltransferase family 2 protein n=1 Tax=Sporolactobacillus laevolacticus TaxID=33018 RepID=UPI0025B336F5|nr:glycosyltransferase family 2 protein [Sporolactobacillus laevolacticus]MDN3954727.1 glycosyltransferase family 2 protein [Sporolactobacillus laevolacticus]